ncbi:MAG TPA: tetratricopeptide repeat protein [Steroidobacteraceae bacterium]|nr:tetratricopeptide repeat protein [Steroidobacteraceae bacterium]
MNSAATLGRAVDLLRRGSTEQAAALCRELIRVQPRDAQALHLLGVIALQQNDTDAGIAFLHRSLAAEPDQPFVCCNLGNALQEIGHADAALGYYQRALQLAPDFAGAFYNLGNALTALDRTEEALASFDRAVALEPEHADAHNNRGNALLKLGRAEAALECYRRALSARPDFALALGNCARALRVLQRYPEAVAIYDRMLTAQPNDGDTLLERGAALLELQRPSEALASLDRAVALQPRASGAWYHRATARLALEEFDRALPDYEESLRLEPEFPEALVGRARALRGLRRSAEALADIERAARLQPGSPDIHYLHAVILRELERPEAAAAGFARVLELAPGYAYARGNLLQTRLQSCDWTDWEASVARVVQEVAAGTRVCLPGPFIPVAGTAAEQLACTRLFVADKHATPRTPLWTGARYRHRRIRVAYVSADFREHPVSRLLAGVIEQHDRERFETLAISLREPPRSSFVARLEQAFDRFIDVTGRGDREVATLLRELEIDIAVDLMGFSGNARTAIFAHRPAPVQVNYLGYTATMALPCIDYIIADRIVIPEADLGAYTEKVAYLPGSYLPSDDTRTIAAETPTRAHWGLPDGGFVFCCFNTHYKINPGCFAIWMRLLAATPGSVLWLAEGSSAVSGNLRAAAAYVGIAPERLVFAPRVPAAADHLARHRLADLFLDTTPFNAHATASDALWAGLPVLTCQGATFAGRVASSLLTAAGLPELISSSLEAYEAKALELAATPLRLAELRGRLERHRSTLPLFDTTRYCRHLEAAYTLMWQRAERGETPRHLTVEPLR